MVLSRNDKIIAALAVVILIAAAIAIILYQPAEEEIIESQMEKTYPVTWTMYPGEKTMTDGLYAGKKSPYTGTFSIDDVPQGSVLTFVKVQVTWQDDHTYGLIFKKGFDKLTVQIGLVGGGSQTYVGTGGGNETLPPFAICDMPSVDSVEANDSYIAEEIIMDLFSGKNSASFDVTASVKIGEKIRRPLKYFGDKGNSFSLKVYYEYYTPMIEEPNDEIPPPEPPVEGTSYLGMMVATGNFGRI